jgi:phosphorylcholine metabolism protein LicD
MEIKDIIKKYFNTDLGFGKYKQIALDLLKQTIDILEEFEINYFIISGTLLGYVRHNDFIPWDDDIDLIVDNSIFDKLPAIMKKYNNIISIVSAGYIIKTCFKDREIYLPYCQWPKFMLNKDDKYFFPFIDLFIYTKENNNTQISFFNKQWNIINFFPAKKVLFNNIIVSIPAVPDYFLKINYGNTYMTILKSNHWHHKTESYCWDIKTITMDEYLNNCLCDV